MNVTSPVISLLQLCLIFLITTTTNKVSSCKYNFLTISKNIFDKDKHVAALILARGSSKGIPLKNLAKIGKQSLIQRTLDVVQRIDFNSIWVSTDNLKILQEIGDRVNVHWRSSVSASDSAPSILGVQDFLKYHPEIDTVALIQCTSPFIKQKYLKQGLFLSKQHNKECVFSVTRSFKLRWLEINGTVEPINFNIEKRPRRQDWNGELVETGMFYFIDRKLINLGLLQNHR